MRIIKVNATKSTNSLGREWYHSNKGENATVIVAKEQTMGRGQRGASWVSNAGENLTMSIVYPSPNVKISDQFLLSAGAGLVIINCLKGLKINNLKLKWPNDIMAANSKIGGILIENILSNGSIAACVIGVGLNVNQEIFPGLPKASSLKSLTAKTYDLDELLRLFVEGFQVFFEELKNLPAGRILSNYEEVLFRKDKTSTFELPNGQFLTGIIKGISPNGLLKVQVEDTVIRTFDLKELKLLF